MSKTQEEIPEEEVNLETDPFLKELAPIDLPEYDFTQHIGQKTKIAKVTPQVGEYGRYLRVETEVVGTLGEGDKAIELRPSLIFSLVENPDVPGRWGWNVKGKLAEFLEAHGVSIPGDLVGKNVVVQLQKSKKEGKEFLTFI